MQSFISLITGAFSLGQAAPNMENFMTAAGASVTIYETIDRVCGHSSISTASYTVLSLESHLNPKFTPCVSAFHLHIFFHSLLLFPYSILQVPTIDSTSNEGEALETFDSTVEFKDVHFSYPTRPDVQVCLALNGGHLLSRCADG